MIVSFPNNMFSHGCLKTCVTLLPTLALRFQIFLGYSIYDTLTPQGGSFCIIVSFVCRCLALDKGGFSDLVVESGRDDSG